MRQNTNVGIYSSKVKTVIRSTKMNLKHCYSLPYQVIFLINYSSFVKQWYLFRPHWNRLIIQLVPKIQAVSTWRVAKARKLKLYVCHVWLYLRVPTHFGETATRSRQFSNPPFWLIASQMSPLECGGGGLFGDFINLFYTSSYYTQSGSWLSTNLCLWVTGTHDYYLYEFK